ncbi:type VII secretion-associated protein [Nocardia sp. CDC159]|uniref:Type VII secretion-associated protein n=1 Tax=Nocardia pulmonis TaxID=2951408 RepID=A0A9X2E8A2_9NOCA|nr:MULTISPECIES: type VII secretion-associated protein [Nocardia]MCM6776142.1 type VII secretion-associated protein [Nocardia pulmonis]MCM6788531.1 type VII secretion-associated protein [Nocardia sp. CDC159]
MSTVEVALTDARLWARGATTHWDGPPSIVPTSDHTGFVAGEPLRPRYPAVSVVRFAAADRIAFGPAAPTITDALATVFTAVLAELRLPGPCERLTVVTPTEWGDRRRHRVAAAARRVAAEVAVEPLALRAAALSASTGQQQRIAVLELAPLTTTVSLVGRSGQQTWIEACEHEPTVGAADVSEGHGIDAVAAVVARLLAGRPPTYLVALSISDAAALETLREAITRRCGFPVDVRAVTGAELLRGAPRATPAPRRLPPPAARAGALREHPGPGRPRRGRGLLVLVGATALALLVAAGVAVMAPRDRAEPSAAPTTTAVPPSPTAASPSASAAPVADDLGRVRLRIPPGWRVTGHSGDRIDLAPNDGVRQRITVTQNPLRPGTTPEDLAAALTAQLRQRPAGTFGPLRPDTSVGRPALAYEEYPADGTTVRWRVIADSATQASIGCQSAPDLWAAFARTCDQFVRDLELTP